jgi:hypothetical protein
MCLEQQVEKKRLTKLVVVVVVLLLGTLEGGGGGKVVRIAGMGQTEEKHGLYKSVIVFRVVRFLKSFLGLK